MHEQDPAAKLPKAMVPEDVAVSNIRKALLVEFSTAPAKREFLIDDSLLPEDPEEAERARASMQAQMTASGLAIHRLIGPDRKVLTQYDPTLDYTPLECLRGRGPVVLVFASPPYGGVQSYHWRLMKLAPVALGTEPVKVAQVTGIRAATDKESKVLGSLFPNWLTMVERNDRATQSPMS